MDALDFDVLVIGSGFGGSVAALRLTEKGYRVGVLEAGARFGDDDFAATSFDVKRYLFRPELGCYGIQRIDMLRDCLILSGAGVGRNVCPTPISVATFSITSSAGVRTGFGTTPSIRLAWS